MSVKIDEIISKLNKEIEKENEIISESEPEAKNEAWYHFSKGAVLAKKRMVAMLNKLES